MKHGCITGVHTSVEYPVAASQIFRRSDGGCFVYADASGHMVQVLTATATIFGYMVIPQGYVSAGTNTAFFTSSATAGADRLPVIRATDAEFLVPATGTVTAALAGNLCDIIAVNDGTGQTADVATSTTDVLKISRLGTDVGGATTDVVVKFNPLKLQSDT